MGEFDPMKFAHAKGPVREYDAYAAAPLYPPIEIAPWPSALRLAIMLTPSLAFWMLAASLIR